jgi:hypothetical protein
MSERRSEEIYCDDADQINKSWDMEIIENSDEQICETTMADTECDSETFRYIHSQGMKKGVDFLPPEPDATVHDPKNDSPKFNFTNPNLVVQNLSKVLSICYRDTTKEQKETMGAHLSEFCAFYEDVGIYSSNPLLHHNPELLVVIFKALEEDRHPFLDKILMVLMILSRHCIFTY